MANAVLMPPPYLQFTDASGVPLAGGLVYTYSAGTTTQKATYTDSTAVTQAANPIVLDSAGRCQIWGSGSYKMAVYDVNNNLIKTVDNFTAYTVPDTGSNSYFQTFSGDGSTTVFTTSSSLGTDPKAIMVFVDAGAGKGYEIQNSTAYTINGTSLTFSVAPASGTNNIYVTAPSLLVNAASASASAAATSETNAAASATLASQWASQTSGIVASTDFSAKAWSVGGTGVTTTSGKGAAKEWATTTGGKVDTVDYSAKEYATGTTVTTGSSKDWAVKTSDLVQSVDSSAKAWAIGGTNITDGAAKNWAQQTGADVTGAALHSRSAKSWAQDALTGATYGGSAKDWAQSASLPDGVSKSAKSYASDASTSATSASTSATNAAASATAAQAATVATANEWSFATSTTMADPSTGNVRFDNATLSSVANIAISASSGDSGNPNLHGYILTWDDSTNSPRGVIKMAKDSTHFVIFGVNGSITDNTTWLQIPVSYITSVGTFSASDALETSFTQYGNNGTLNTTGTPASGNLAKFSGATTLTNGDLSGDVTTAGTLVTSIGAGKVTNAMLAGSIDLTTKVANTLSATNGGTGNGFTAFTGPTTSIKTFTLPNASATILTDNAVVTSAQGGTGFSTYTKGDLIISSATNTLFKLPIGSGTQVLGISGGAPAWVAAGGSELVFISSATASSSAALDFTALPSGYSKFVAVIVNLKLSASGTDALAMRVSTDNTTYATTTYNSMSNRYDSSGTQFSLNVANGALMKLASCSSVAATAHYNFTVDIFNANTAGGAAFTWQGVINDTGTAASTFNFDGGGAHNVSETVTAIRFMPDGSGGGNITSGTIYLYGVKNS